MFHASASSIACSIGSSGPPRSRLIGLVLLRRRRTASPFTSAPDRFMQLQFKQSPLRQRGEVFCYADLSLGELEQLDLFMILAAAEYEPNWGFLGFRVTLVLVQPAEVEFHLTFVGCFEPAEFQFDRNQPP